MEEEIRLKETDSDEHSFVPNDLKFIRDMVEKSHQEIDPEAPVMIVWGLVCMIGYTAIYFLVMHQLTDRPCMDDRSGSWRCVEYARLVFRFLWRSGLPLGSGL